MLLHLSSLFFHELVLYHNLAILLDLLKEMIYIDYYCIYTHLGQKFVVGQGSNQHITFHNLKYIYKNLFEKNEKQNCDTKNL